MSRSSVIHAKELVDCVNRRLSESRGKDYLRRSVIPGLRDAGMLITGRSTGGYKLASSRQDLAQFARHARDICEAMLRRLRMARDHTRTVTLNEVDILAPDDFRTLSRLVDVVSEADREAMTGLSDVEPNDR